MSATSARLKLTPQRKRPCFDCGKPCQGIRCRKCATAAGTLKAIAEAALRRGGFFITAPNAEAKEAMEKQ